MKTLTFFGDITPLVAGVRRGQLKRISSDFSHYGCISLTLWLTSGEGFRITTTMQPLAERIEVGTLHVELVIQGPREEMSVDLPWSFRSGGTLSRLIMKQGKARVESGILLRSVDGDEVIILPAASPHRLYVGGINSPKQEVTPEYSLQRYLHEEV